jgi:hypothetical protein
MNIEKAKAFEEKLIELINSCELPVEMAYYIVKNQLLELELLYNNVLYSRQITPSLNPDGSEEQEMSNSVTIPLENIENIENME